ncbi:hypothetical protein [Maledivibacter halophilus]|uniref:Repeat domain-containing protein n=1 Tax=Maledivibacter halophilus TaxID=36842 RepID=A0A1T5MWI5_9FIRM|nr:hypothetical protein [Maledivibacter halophilus]SKC92269.1 hypothetical protein SAMN02194393_05450 [Maledivibacter halophilus]
MYKKNIIKKASALLLTGCLAAGGVYYVNAQSTPNSQIANLKIGDEFTIEKLDLGDNAYVIDYKSEDVTGDEVKDDIILVGNKMQKEDIFSTSLNVVVKDGKTNEYSKATYENFGGYEGTLYVQDFSGDKINDVMVSTSTGGSGGIYDHFIATFKDNNPTVIFDNKDNEGVKAEAKFIDDFKVEINIEGIGQKAIVDVSVNKDKYIEDGLYDKNGKVLKDSAPFSYPFSLVEARDYNGDGTYELIGHQRVVGLYNADTISHIDTVWSYKDSKWTVEELKYSTYIKKYDYQANSPQAE